MSKKLCLVLGNGFTIDLVNSAGLSEQIDVLNLFSKGAELPWPETGEPGFLSYKHCPNLWNLGVRPNADKDSVMGLLEDIITCVNVRVLTKKPRKHDGSKKSNDIYIDAYYELTSYLRTLFTYYDGLIDDGELADKLADWEWLEFLKRANESDQYDSITIITYNYDIWLERLLKEVGIAFKVSHMDSGGYEESSKISIVKPHGSISFYYKTQYPSEFNVGYGKAIPGEAITEDFKVDYSVPLSKCLINAMIPPAGDSERIKSSWAGQIRATASHRAKELSDNDELMICGISYWHVDRSEVDELLTNCSPELNVYMFNPYPNKSMDAVLTSTFPNYVYYSCSSTLSGRLI